MHTPPVQVLWQCDLRDDSLQWSQGVYDLFGLPRRMDVSRDEILDMYLPHSREELSRLRRRAILEGSSFTFEAEIRRAHGELRWIRVTADVVCEDGAPRYLYGSKIDVTEEMRARQRGVA